MSSSDKPSSTRPPRVAVVHNTDYELCDESGGDDEPPSLEADAEVAETAAAVAEALRERGYDPVILTVSSEAEPLVSRLAECDAKVVFNLVESLARDSGREAEVPELLEKLRVPYTGNGPRALRAANAKDRVRVLLSARGLSVARGASVRGVRDLRRDALKELRYPLFVKPARTDGSIGIDQRSVVTDERQLRDRLAWLARALPGPFLVEEYLPGREINVAIFPDPVNGVTFATEVDFAGYPADYEPIVTYDCKWRPGSPEYVARSVPARGRVPESVLDDACVLARAAFRAVGGTSYGRVDMRLDRDGRPCVIDINTNPDLHPEAGLAISAASVGLTYGDLVTSIVAGATLKTRHVHPTHPGLRSRTAGSAVAAY